MFLQVSVRLSVHMGGPHLIIIHDALDHTVQVPLVPALPPQHET